VDDAGHGTVKKGKMQDMGTVRKVMMQDMCTVKKGMMQDMGTVKKGMMQDIYEQVTELASAEDITEHENGFEQRAELP
jgi:hypothetical protein